LLRSVLNNQLHLQLDLAADELEWHWEEWDGAAKTYSRNYERDSETFGLDGGTIVTASTFEFKRPTTITLEYFGDPTPVVLALAAMNTDGINMPVSYMDSAVLVYDSTWNGVPLLTENGSVKENKMQSRTIV
jgi:hypothetical protein